MCYNTKNLYYKCTFSASGQKNIKKMQNVFSDFRVRTGRVKEANPQFHCGFVRSVVGCLFGVFFVFVFGFFQNLGMSGNKNWENEEKKI